MLSQTEKNWLLKIATIGSFFLLLILILGASAGASTSITNLQEDTLLQCDLQTLDVTLDLNSTEEENKTDAIRLIPEVVRKSYHSFRLRFIKRLPVYTSVLRYTAWLSRVGNLSPPTYE